MNKLTVTIAGKVKSGKTTLAVLIQSLLSDYGIYSTLTDLDGPLSSLHRDTHLNHAEEILAKDKVEIKIEVVQLARQAKE